MFASHGHARTDEFGVGDIAYIPQGFGHYIENIGNDDLKLLLVFNHGDYKSLDLADWLASNPRALVAQNFGVPEDVIAKFATGGMIVEAKMNCLTRCASSSCGGAGRGFSASALRWSIHPSRA